MERNGLKSQKTIVEYDKVKESVSGYAGKFAGGDGHQFLISNDVLYLS